MHKKQDTKIIYRQSQTQQTFNPFLTERYERQTTIPRHNLIILWVSYPLICQQTNSPSVKSQTGQFMYSSSCQKRLN